MKNYRTADATGFRAVNGTKRKFSENVATRDSTILSGTEKRGVAKQQLGFT